MNTEVRGRWTQRSEVDEYRGQGSVETEVSEVRRKRNSNDKVTVRDPTYLKLDLTCLNHRTSL